MTRRYPAKSAAVRKQLKAMDRWFDTWECKHGSRYARQIAVAICGCERPCAGCNGTGKAMARIQYADRACAMGERPCPLCQ